MEPSFEWDPEKELLNFLKHGLTFEQAQAAFFDPARLIVEDQTHSTQEPRFHCIGKVGDGIATVRFTWRKRKIRIFGAGYWREGRRIYEEKNSL